MKTLFKGSLAGLFDRYNMGLSIDIMEWSGINKNKKRGSTFSRSRPPNLGQPSGKTPRGRAAPHLFHEPLGLGFGIDEGGTATLDLLGDVWPVPAT